MIQYCPMTRLALGNVGDVTAILIGRVGDLIVSTPMLRALNRHWPGARIRLVVQSACEDAASLIPFVDDVKVLGRWHKAASHIQLAAALASGPCDLLVDLNPSFSRTSAALAALVRAPVKAGFRKDRLDSVFTHQVEAPGEREHMLERYARLCALLGAPYEPLMELRLNPADEARAERHLSTLGLPDGPRVLVHPGNFKKFDNRWPEEKFVSLVDRLQEARPDLQTLFLSGPGEKERVDAINAALKKPSRVLPAMPLGVIGALMRRVDLCLLNVTGTTHLAAALDVPTFCFYAGYTDAVWRPRGARHGGVVSPSWTSCREISVDEAWSALQPALPAAKRA